MEGWSDFSLSKNVHRRDAENDEETRIAELPDAFVANGKGIGVLRLRMRDSQANRHQNDMDLDKVGLSFQWPDADHAHQPADHALLFSIREQQIGAARGAQGRGGDIFRGQASIEQLAGVGGHQIQVK